MATLQHMRTLVQSKGWQELLIEIKKRIESIDGQLESITIYEELLRLQGEARGMRYLMVLPEVIIEALEEEQGE